MEISMQHLSFSYGETPILQDICLRVPHGASIGILGSSGGGKSTLLKLISGLYEVTAGRICIGDADTAEARRCHAAMAMQNAMLLPASIRDNITCGHPIPIEQIELACRVAQLDDWLATLPDGLDSFVGERGNRVSGGQAQRIAIARAVAKNAPVVLLDEPTSALDGDTGDAVLAALAGLARGKTVLHVSHQMASLVGCQSILRLEGGRLYAL